MTTYSVVGTPVASEGGQDKVLGQTLYAADIVLPGMIWGKVLRSPLPHARILAIDTSRAEKVPGVRAVITGADTAGMRVGRLIYDVPLLADGKVRFVGERVAAVAADDPDAAEEGQALIDVEYEELPAVFGAAEAMEAGAPLVHDEGSSYRSNAGPIVPQGNVGFHEGWSGGDIERGFEESDLVLEHTFTTPWVHQGYIEPFTCVVDIDGEGRIQVWANNKQPFGLRRQLSASLGIPEERIRVNPCGIGGDFGGKAGAMDVPLAYTLSQRSGRPVKMVMSYIEELMAGNPRHPSETTIRTGVKRDGTLWARKTSVVFNAGAYAGFRGSPGLRGGRQAGGGPYVTPNFQIDLHMVYTNNVPCGSYRAPGEPQAVFAVESHTDMIAHELGMDPYEFRLRNVVHEGDVSATGQTFRHVRAEETLRKAAGSAGWGSAKRGRHFGRGIALGQRPAAGATSVARVTVDADARVTLHTAVPDTGVGAHTVGRQVVAEDLGVPVDRVSLHRWDTDAVPFDTGAGAATTRIAGNAAFGAAQEARKELTRLAAEFYGWPEERIVFKNARVFVEGDPDQGVAIEELAARAVSARGAPISSDSTYSADQPAEVTSYCAQVADVEVDAETGQVTVHRIVTAHDVGTILNPLGHQGQIDGAVIQGLGYALMEELQAEEGRISTLSLGEAKMPVSMDIPELVTELLADEVESPEELGPYSGKGIGEVPISPVAPAIANAVYDAVGVRITDLPITAEKVLRGLEPGL